MRNITFQHYLEAKTTVDDRALNTSVWSQVQAMLRPWPACNILDVGAGVGTMFDRVIAWGLYEGPMVYTGVDLDPVSIRMARKKKRNLPVDVSLQFEVADILTFQPVSPPDLIIAHAVMDLMDMAAALDYFRQIARPDAYFYFTIVFDGITHLSPSIDPELDHRIEQRYHADMDNRHAGHTGGSRAGRNLLRYLVDRRDIDLLGVGPSDWVVFPVREGYPGDEATFLHFIINTMHHALKVHPDLTDDLPGWIEKRHQQIDQGELVYVAHQLDFFGQFK